MPAPQDFATFELGDFTLQGGATLRGAHVAYKTYGTLNGDGTNAILVPTWYSSWHHQNEWMIGPDRALDPDTYFIVSANMLGNGLSTSPNNTPPPYGRGRFPSVTFFDQVEAQHALLTQGLGVTSLELVTGSSMGAAQTYQWAVSHPEMVRRAAPIVGASITSEHNQVFLKGLTAALRADAAFADGWYTSDRFPSAGMRAFARIYAGWGLSQAFYWQREYLSMGYSSLEDFLVGFWEGYWLDDRDPNNLLTMLGTWQHGDVGLTPGFDGDTEAALRSIQCPVLAMPCRTDLYFPPEDEEWASALIPNGQVKTIDSIYGHFAGLGFYGPDNDFIDQNLKSLLSR